MIGQIWRTIVTAKPYLVIFFIISSIVSLLISFSEIPHFNYNTPLGMIVFRLCMSYISSFIFYFIVVHVPKQKDRDYIYQYIKNDVCNVVDYGKNLSKHLRDESKISFDKYPDKTNILLICKAVKGDSVIKNEKLISLMLQYKLKTLADIYDIYSKMPFIEGKLIYLIDNIKDCLYFDRLDNYNVEIHGDDLAYFHIPLIMYFESIQELDEYVDDKFKYYKRRKPLPKEIKKLIKKGNY